MYRIILLFLFCFVWLGVLAAGCSGKDGDPSPTPDGSETPTPDDETPSSAWTVEKVEEGDVGLQTHLEVDPNGQVTLAYWANTAYEDGICEEVAVDPPVRLRQPLYFARRDLEGWTVEQVDAPVVALAPMGLSLQYDAAGRAAIAYTGGEPEGQYCGANDAVLATRDADGWTFETAGAKSDDSATGNEASDAGFVVGLWPALAFDPAAQPAMLYKDAHFGSLQHDDLYRADAEFAWRSSSAWQYEAVDAGEGAGDYGALCYDTEGRPVAFYAITVQAQEDSRQGVWAARPDGEGGWTRVRLHAGAIHQEIEAGLDPVAGDLVVAFYSVEDRAVRVRRLSDLESFADSGAWTSELVASPQYDEGQDVSLAFTPSGQLALAYHRCRRLTSGSEACDQNDEAAVFALDGENGWKIEVVYQGERGSCGEYTALGFDDQGMAYVAFRCTEETDEGFFLRLFVASKRI